MLNNEAKRQASDLAKMIADNPDNPDAASWGKGTPLTSAEDDFRPRKTRSKGWLKQAIKDGSVRAPGEPNPDDGKDYPDATVVRPPAATLSGDGQA